MKSFSLKWPIFFFKIGGWNGGNLDSTEIINSHGSVTAGISLPYKVHGHCVVTLNDGRVMILGGFDGSSMLRKVLIFNSTSGTFSHAPDMLYTRIYHGCASFNSPLHNCSQHCCFHHYSNRPQPINPYMLKRKFI